MKKEFYGVKRLSESQAFIGGKLIEVPYPVTENSPYIIDDSAFIPISEALKQLDNASPISEDKLADYYDFANGSDTGISIPIGRNPQNSSDITEISTAITDKVKDITDKVSKINEAIETEKAFNESLSKISATSPGSKSEK